MPTSSRLQELFKQLEDSAGEYRLARDGFERSRVRFELAKEKFASLRNMAGLMTHPMDVHYWQEEHSDIRYVGRTVGDAIRDVLYEYAHEQAIKFAKGDIEKYHTLLNIADIVNRLEEGGFEFNSITPAREVNAAVTRLNRINKVRRIWYEISEKDEILEIAIDIVTRQKKGELSEGKIHSDSRITPYDDKENKSEG